ncbi:MAG: efflux RND transporter permease subunit [Pseudomonadales bacterium]
MIAQVIRWSIANRFLVLLASVGLLLWGVYSIRVTPVDAIPDLSDVQVIVKTSYPGQAPQVVEDQITYPLATALLAVPKAATVRSYSFFGDSYVYVIFEDGTDLYWARTRVLEYLNQVASKLPAQVRPELGPDATGVGWIFQYALIDRSGKHDLASLRSLQDWYLKYELQTVHGVSEIATVGGMVRQYQVVVDPHKLRAYKLSLTQVRTAIERANQETGASVIEMSEAEYMVRTNGYIQGLDQLRQIPLLVNASGTPLLLGDLASIQMGPQMRRGIAELNGEGEVVGGIVVMRSGENAKKTIDGVKKKLEQLRLGLPEGVEIKTVYDRSILIDSAVDNLYQKLAQEFVVVAIICALFLFHLRSSLVIVISLPLGILTAFIVMRLQGINANIMSLGGVAIAIGAMVDGAIVLVENVHRHFEKQEVTDENRWQVITEAAVEVGPALFYSLLIITLSFMPVFALQAQEGRMFSPLAYTKTYAMAAAAGLAVTLVPVLTGYFARGNIRREADNPINRLMVGIYRPVLAGVLRMPLLVVSGAVLVMVFGLLPARELGSEFMPPLDEGDMMYMPTTYAGISVGKARQVLQQTNKLIRTVPEVETVFGKVGRAETATDPAPLTMIETIVHFKPKELWRPGVTTESLRQEIDQLIQFPGLTNAFVMPIKTRIDMLATGIKTPLGVKVAGPDLQGIEEIGQQLEQILKGVDGTASVYSERVTGGRYIKVDIDRQKAARFGMNVADVQAVVKTAIGGVNVTETVEGLERYPVNLRYPQHYRDSVEQLRLLPVVSPTNQQIALADIADIYVEDGPPAIKSENARLNGWTYVDIADRDLGSYVEEARQRVADQLRIPPGYSISWSGQYEYMERAKQSLALMIPLTLCIIVLLLYANFRSFVEVAIIMGTVPFALLGGVWLILLLDFDLSVAVGIGFIALAGVAVEIGVLMLVYLNQAFCALQQQCANEGRPLTRHEVSDAVMEGAALRLRPILMTTIATTAGLLPIMFGGGTGTELMQRIAGPMIGGMLSTLILALVIIPAVYLLWRRKGLAAD